MILLVFGTRLVQDRQIAGLQLIYGLSYATLLRYNHYSLDAAFGIRRLTPQGRQSTDQLP